MNSRTNKIFRLLRERNSAIIPENLENDNSLNTSASMSTLPPINFNLCVEDKNAPDSSELITELAAQDDYLIFPLDGEIVSVNDAISLNPSQYEIVSEHTDDIDSQAETTIQAQEHDVEGENENNKEDEVEDPSYVPNNSISEILSSDDEDTKITHKVKRQRKKRSNKETWDCNQNKYKRMRGLDYKGRGKSEKGKAVFNKPRSARKMLPPCNCKQGLKGKALKCKEFSLENRQKIFNEFWETLNWQERKHYIRGLVDVIPVKRKSQDNSRRDSTFVLKLKKDGISYRVCKKMFLNTLGIGEWSLHNWTTPLINKSNSNHDEATQKVKNPRNSENRMLVRKFFDSLPKMESHYCRSRSNKLYLEPLWQSKADLFQEYRKFCGTDNPAINPVSIKTFTEVFEELNLSLFQPKKDQCDLCTNFRARNLPEDEYLQHQKRKEDARKEKEKDKAEAKHLYCMDLQKVLLSPMSYVSTIYYKRKLCVHNFTLYNMKNHEGFCYLWHEGEGDITAQEFSSIICNFILNQEIREGEDVILYSDNCGYQNKNVTLSNALLNLAFQKNIYITQIFLEKGHTQMEVDSMHACIERRLRNRDINIPAEYAAHCKKARKLPKPYHVQYLNHSFFHNYSKIKYCNSIRPGIRSGDPVVTDLKAIRYTPNKEIYMKLNHTDEWSLLNKRLNKNVIPVPNDSLPNLYSGPRDISKDKFDNLQELKSTLLADFHSFYDQLNFK